MLNQSTIMGRLTADVELRATANKTPVVAFTVAVERDFKNQNGERETDFINCVAWKHTAEFMNKYCKKGQLVVVDGRLQVRSWNDNNGAKRYATEIVAESVYLAGSKKEQSDNKQEEYSALDELRGNQSEFMPLDNDDIIPF